MARKQQHARRNGKPVVLPDNWAEPYTFNELAVDGKKVSDISSWLSSSRNKSGILLLTGPTGCGKTAALKCVARSLNFELREWVTPLDRNFEDGAETGVFQSQSEKFEDFLYSCSRYSDLFVRSSSVASLLVVEDYPNIFFLKPEKFFDVLERYRKTARAPIVFICSNVADEGLDIERDLFPDHIRSKLQITRISLNAVTRTRMLQALKRMGALLQTLTPGYKIPTLDAIAEICDSSNGDVRYAMLTLQMKPQEDVEAMFELAGKKGTGQKKKNSQKLTEEEELIATCGKDDRVGVLHGVGRVLFPKWLNEGERALLSSKRKRKDDSKNKDLNATVPGVEWYHNPNTIVDSYLSSDSLIVLLVQENYLKTFTSIESVADAAHCLSEADVLRNGVGFEASHEISFNLAVRGVMVHNKVPHRTFSPVKGSRCRELLDTQKKLLSLTETLFPLYPIKLTTLMTEVIPYMAHSCSNSLSNDQRKFVSLVASMQPLVNISDLFTTFREPYSEQKIEKASFVMNQREIPVEQDDELHISEDESDQETDEGAENLTLLAAAMDEDVDMDQGAHNLPLLEAAVGEEQRREEIDYQALLNDSDDDDILLSQL